MKSDKIKIKKLYVLPIMLLVVVGMGFIVSCNKIEPGSNVVRKPDVDSSAIGALAIDTLEHSVALKHVGGLHTPEDFSRIKERIAANDQDFLDAFKKLTDNPHAQPNYTPHPTVKLVRGGNSREEPDPDNYSNAMNDAAAAYQLALRWKISEDDIFAETAINILNAWARTCTKVTGDSNSALGGGIYGYQFALAAELLRDYTGWDPADFAAYQQWMIDVFYSINMAFLTSHWGTCDSHYWANWDLANLASVLAIGILTDNRYMYNYAINYLQNGNGNGNWYKAINHVFTGEDAGLAQIQESGRDQGHSTFVIALLGIVSQIAWNQGDDFFGLDDNRFLKACEYVAKYNVAFLDVPFNEYTRDFGSDCSQTETHTQISDAGRGTVRPMWALPYYHYTKIKEKAAPFTKMGVEQTQPEGGGGDYGPNSGGYDQLGFGTLMYAIP